jgi:3'-5' exoribonuclease
MKATVESRIDCAPSSQFFRNPCWESSVALKSAFWPDDGRSKVNRDRRILTKACGSMPRQYLKDLKDGDSVEEVYVLADKQLRANRNANLYLLTGLRDRSGVMNGLMWNVTEELVANYDAGDFVQVRGKVQLYQGSLQIILTNVQTVAAETLNLDDFEQRPSQDTDRMLARMREILQSIDEPSVKALMECFLIDEELMRSFTRAPAGVKAHHAYHGGLLEHVVNMLETAVRIADLYPAIDINLLLAGIFLHDLGKVREMAFDTSFTYTDEGQLLGHLIIAIEMLTRKINEAEKLTGEPFPEEIALRLKHMIASHHGNYEFGSPKLPMTPEAIALHHLDNLDAKVHEFSRTIDGDPNSQSHWTPFIPRIDRKLFKGCSESNGA